MNQEMFVASGAVPVPESPTGYGLGFEPLLRAFLPDGDLVRGEPFRLVPEPAQLETDFLSVEVVVPVAASVESGQGQALVQIKTDCVRVAGLGFQYHCPAALPSRLLLGEIQQGAPDTLPAELLRNPELGYPQAVGPGFGAGFDRREQLFVLDSA